MLVKKTPRIGPGPTCAPTRPPDGTTPPAAPTKPAPAGRRDRHDPRAARSTRGQRELKEGSRMRIWSSPLREARWFSFELSSDADIHDALDWLGRAYNAAAKSKKS